MGPLLVRGSPQPPLLVCGLPRSGTSLTRDLLNTTANILILDEFPKGRFASFFSLAREVAAADSGYETWRKTNATRHLRLLDLLATTWAVVSREPLWRAFRQGKVQRVGMKTPLAELDYGEYEELLGELAPHLVYCWRPPLAVYESLLSLAWGSHHTPEGFTELLVRSLRSVLDLWAKAPQRVFVFQVAQTSSPSLRKRHVARLLHFAGGKRTWKTVSFVRRWPAVNAREKGPPSELPEVERKRRLDHLQVCLRESPELMELVRPLGLSLD
ncbi:MAG: sulfotransferase [Thermoanaerobaculum sp.]|nr:sulfotransferase [Thermoanaerobaculum sp.]